MPGREPSESLSIKTQKPTPKNTPTIQVATAPVDTKSQMGPSDLLRATVFRTIGRIVESLSIPAGFDRNVGMVTSICSLAQLHLGVRKSGLIHSLAILEMTTGYQFLLLTQELCAPI